MVEMAKSKDGKIVMNEKDRGKLWKEPGPD